MAGATAAVGFIPGYAVIGVLPPVILLLLRATQGLAAGGELGVAGALVFERAPSQQRGRLVLAYCHAGPRPRRRYGYLSRPAGRARLSSLEVGWWQLALIVALPLGLVAIGTEG